MTPEAISEAQRLIPPRPAVLRTRDDFRRVARWWELEALRGYSHDAGDKMTSSQKSALYGRNMRWCAEVVLMTGRPGTFTELCERKGWRP